MSSISYPIISQPKSVKLRTLLTNSNLLEFFLENKILKKLACIIEIILEGNVDDVDNTDFCMKFLIFYNFYNF